ncbi:MAG: XdhC family protein [Fidelibacterota bacterium]
MNEPGQILLAYNQIRSRGESCSLVTLVHVEGSHYRKPGARCLIDAHGKITGSIGGGCMDNDLILHSKAVMDSRKPALVRYDSTSDEDIIFGLGIACGGVVDVLVEPMSAGSGELMMKAVGDCVNGKKTLLIGTVYESDIPEIPAATRMIRYPDGRMEIDLDHPQLKTKLFEVMTGFGKPSKPGAGEIPFDEGVCRVLWEILTPPLNLMIMGGGNDSFPLVNYAHELGWEVTVTDHRQGFSTMERFPKAGRVITAGPEEFGEICEKDRPDAVVILTHNFPKDVEVLRQILPLNIPYVGLLGSTRRRQRILDELRKTGFEMTKEIESGFHSPAGLSIPADSPAEIALSIVAEIQQTLG